MAIYSAYLNVTGQVLVDVFVEVDLFVLMGCIGLEMPKEIHKSSGFSGTTTSCTGSCLFGPHMFHFFGILELVLDCVFTGVMTGSNAAWM